MNYREEVARKQAQDGNVFKAQQEKMVADRFKRCEQCGKKVGVPFRIYEDMHFCSKWCYQRYFGSK